MIAREDAPTLRGQGERYSNHREEREGNELECIETSKGRKQVGLRTGATTKILDHPGIDNSWDYILGGDLWYLLLALEGVFGQMNP